MDLVEATVHSVNTVYAQLILDVGLEEAVKTASDLGITSELKALPSAVLGTNDVSPLEMAAAYATLANHGVAVDPVYVTKVVDSPTASFSSSTTILSVVCSPPPWPTP